MDLSNDAEFDLAPFAQPAWNAPDSVAKALATLSHLSDQREYWAAYNALLSAVGNNHAGTYFPVVLPVVQKLQVFLVQGSCLGRRLALEVLLDWTTSFGPEPPWGAELERAVREAAFALRPSIETIALSNAASPDERRLARELVDGLSDHRRV
jgi:hypothetical protein